jgi:16S rRNA processing protein RimM
MERTQYFSIGYVKKSFGNEGLVSIDVEDQAIDLLDELKHVFIYLDGAYIPFFIDHVDEKTGLVLKFDEVDSPEAAGKLSNKKIYITEDQFGKGGHSMLSINTELDGYTIYNDGKLLSEVIDVEEYPSQLMVKIKVNGEEKLIPLVEDFIEKIDNKKKLIYLRLPEGLLDL